MQLRLLKIDLVAVMHNQHIGSLYRQKRKWHSHRPIVKMSINRVSTIFWLCIFGFLGADWLEISRNTVLAAISGNNNHSRVPAQSEQWASTSISNVSGLHGCGPGQEPPRNLYPIPSAGLLPGPDINQQVTALVGTGLQFHFNVATTLAEHWLQ